MGETLLWISAVLIFPLLSADTRGAAWAFLLGAEMAVGLTAFLELAARALG